MYVSVKLKFEDGDFFAISQSSLFHEQPTSISFCSGESRWAKRTPARLPEQLLFIEKQNKQMKIQNILREKGHKWCKWGKYIGTDFLGPCLSNFFL